MDFQVNKKQYGNTQVIRHTHLGITAVTIVIVRDIHGMIISLTVSVDPQYSHYLAPGYIDIMVRNAIQPGKFRPVDEEFGSEDIFF